MSFNLKRSHSAPVAAGVADLLDVAEDAQVACEWCNFSSKLYNAFIGALSHLCVVVKINSHKKIVEMRKLKVCIVAAFMMIAVIPAQLSAATGTTPEALAKTELVESEAANALIARLEAINAMDKTGMSSTEKRAMRKEVRSINQELKAIRGGGIYLSVGAVILIVLLLILLL